MRYRTALITELCSLTIKHCGYHHLVSRTERILTSHFVIVNDFFVLIVYMLNLAAKRVISIIARIVYSLYFPV